jgi:hypothetical protein
MGFIPKDEKWNLAEIVEQIRVEGDRRNVVHTNVVLVRADSADEAYEKALALGKLGNTKYKNPEEKMVTIRFRGLRELNVIHEELEHGCEITFSEDVGVREKRIKKWAIPKKKLGVFAPIQAPSGPNYADREIMRELYLKFPHLKPKTKSERRKAWKPITNNLVRSGDGCWLDLPKDPSFRVIPKSERSQIVTTGKGTSSLVPI